MKRLNISIDVTKIQKDRLRENKFTTKKGEEVKQTLCDIVCVPIEKKLIKEGDTYKMYKVGFVVEKGGKEENTNILGDVMEFENTESQVSPQEDVSTDIDVSQIPF
jgi:hypothetical protein